ncbi:hypothetical protein P9209_17245 [Prescottella defluvii]|nr:hypothetical protein P9209_17245 [Prescottella defluvii]
MVYDSGGGVRIWVSDSIAFAGPAQSGDFLVTGSHGGVSAGEYATSFGVAVVVCNDAGIGKTGPASPGSPRYPPSGIAGIGVSHDTARIGDGTDGWEHGIVSYVDEVAQRLGIRVGAPLREQLLELTARKEW